MYLCLCLALSILFIPDPSRPHSPNQLTKQSHYFSDTTQANLILFVYFINDLLDITANNSYTTTTTLHKTNNNNYNNNNIPNLQHTQNSRPHSPAPAPMMSLAICSGIRTRPSSLSHSPVAVPPCRPYATATPLAMAMHHVALEWALAAAVSCCPRSSDTSATCSAAT